MSATHFPMVRTFAYGRFSTAAQEEGTTIENQLLACKKYANTNGLTIVKEFADLGVSGTISMENRPEGRKMIQAVNDGECDAIVIYVPDRANRDMLNALMLRRFLKRKGVQIHYTNLGLIKGMTEVLATLLDMLAEQEVEAIRDRTSTGRKNKVKLHKKPVLNDYPYGYKKIGLKKDAYLIIDPEQSRIVTLIFEFYVFKGYTLQGIADHLNTLNIPTRSGNMYNQTGKGWKQAHIQQILKTTLYKGIYRWGITALKEKEHDMQPQYERRYNTTPEQWEYLEIPELAIVSSNLWDLAQERLEKNRELSRWTSRNHGSFLLTGFIKCGHCHRSMGGAAPQEKLKDGTIIRRFKYKDQNRECPAYGSGITQHILDNKVWD